MPWEHIDLDVNDAIATVTLNRPESLNSFAGTMREDLLAAIQVASNCSRVLILAGAGKAFCGGGDVRAMENLREEDLKTFIRQGKRVVACLRSLPIPTMASIHGVAAGAGFSLALACDLRIASRTARLGATFSRIGLHPDWGGTYFLTKLTGPATARDLVLSGRLIDSDEALRLGLINWVVPGEDLPRFTREEALELRDAPPVSVRWAREAIALAERGSLEEVLDFEEKAQLACFATEDRREGLRAFLEKRRPVFKGK
ncbi:MAG TPA: enoyl-CoA hydratase-related protein [Vicinamibacteria bacterium]